MLVIYLLFSIPLPLRCIHLQRTRITRLFAGDKFFLFFTGECVGYTHIAVNEFAL